MLNKLGFGSLVFVLFFFSLNISTGFIKMGRNQTENVENFKYKIVLKNSKVLGTDVMLIEYGYYFYEDGWIPKDSIKEIVEK